MNNELYGERPSQNRSIHIYETLCRYSQPNNTLQSIPLQSLQATEQQPQLKAADGNCYAQCPLYDTGTYRCEYRSQQTAETSFSLPATTRFSGSGGLDHDSTVNVCS